MPRQQKFHENRLWTAVHGLWKHLGDAYVHCVHGHEANLGGASAIKKNMPVIVARAIRTLTLQLKWVLLRYSLPEARIWADLARLYKLAEDKGYATGAVAIYPGSHGSGTVQQEFLKAMMLWASSTDGLPPVRQEMADGDVDAVARRAVDDPRRTAESAIGGRRVNGPIARFGGADPALFPLGRDDIQLVATGAQSYWCVADIQKAWEALIAAGAQPNTEIVETGDDIKVASVIEVGGSFLGLIENPHFVAAAPPGSYDGPGR